MKFKFLLLLCPALCFAAPGPQMMQTDMPMQQTIPEFGVTKEQFMQCCKVGRPEQMGGIMNTTAIAQCLQQYNSNITAEQVESFIQRHPLKMDIPKEKKYAPNPQTAPVEPAINNNGQR